AEVSVRIDAPSGGAPAVSLLAFRATVTGPLAASDVLGVVDPWVAPGPAARCDLHEVGATARTLRAQGGTVDLEEIANVSLMVGEALLKPVPRVYPQLASGLGGVIGEAGPLEL